MHESVKLSVLAGAIVVGCAIAAAPMAFAQDGPDKRQPGFETLDADGDGALTQAEMEAHRSARFAEADADGNGSLSADEMMAMGQKRKSDRAARMIERLDANSDGEVSEEELAQHRGKRGQDGFSRMDADGDGAVTKAEFEDAKKKRRAFFEKRRNQRDG